MRRELGLHLSRVKAVPHGLRETASLNQPAATVMVDLAKVYQHYYFDGYGVAPPSPDPSRFEYAQHLAPTPDLRFLSHVERASTVRRRGLSADLGQALCRWSLDEHFGVRFFAHLNRVLDQPQRQFGGLTVSRSQSGDIPDYLCARTVTKPLIAEAKGRFSAVAFGSAEFGRWRDQFARIRVTDGTARLASIKGFIVATRFTTEDHPRVTPALFIEDPATPGEPPSDGATDPELGRTIISAHYARVFRRIGLDLLGAALERRAGVPTELSFQVPRFTCVASPFEGRSFIGGVYRTQAGPLPELTPEGWRMPMELGSGHGVFVGLEDGIAADAAQVARGERSALDEPAELLPETAWSSEFGWLRDGTVMAPMTYFVPTGRISL